MRNYALVFVSVHKQDIDKEQTNKKPETQIRSKKTVLRKQWFLQEVVQQTTGSDVKKCYTGYT